MIKFRLNKEMDGKVQNVNPRDYYQSLSKKEKGMFLEYLLSNYGMKTNTIRCKLTKVQWGKLTKLEELTLVDVIKSGKWKQ